MRGGQGTAMKRTKLKEHADGYHSGAREEQGQQVLRRRSSVEGVNITQEAQGCQTSRVSGVSHLKPDICSRTASITDPVEICGKILSIIICHRASAEIISSHAAQLPK